MNTKQEKYRNAWGLVRVIEAMIMVVISTTMVYGVWSIDAPSLYSVI